MGFKKGMAISCLILMAIGSTAQGEIAATTDSGKKVILNEDGNWKYREALPEEEDGILTIRSHLQ